MGNYSVPEKIRRLKPKGTRVKPIKGELLRLYTFLGEGP